MDFHIVFEDNGQTKEITTKSKPIIYSSDIKYFYKAIKNNDLNLLRKIISIIKISDIDDEELSHSIEICLIKEKSPFEIIKFLVESNVRLPDEIFTHVIYYHDYDSVKYLLENKLVNQDVIDDGLITAIEQSDPKIVKLLLAWRASIKANNFQAVRRAITPDMKFEVIKSILDGLDNLEWDDKRPLFLAIQQRRLDVVKELLIKRKVSPEFQHLVIALEIGDPVINELILKHINNLSQDELNILFKDALYNKDIKTIEILNKLGAVLQVEF